MYAPLFATPARGHALTHATALFSPRLGRVKALIESEALGVDRVRIFVLDEADKLLEKNFTDQIKCVCVCVCVSVCVACECAGACWCFSLDHA